MATKERVIATGQTAIVAWGAGIAREEGETAETGVVLFDPEGDQESHRARVALNERAILGLDM
jgi:hypothetical protein